MRDDLFCFAFMGHRVCVMLDERSTLGWSYTIDGCTLPPPDQDISYAQRVLLQEAGMVARDTIRAMRPSGEAPVTAALQKHASDPSAPVTLA